MKEASLAVESYQEGAAEGCDHSGSHRRSRSCVVRGMVGGGGPGSRWSCSGSRGRAGQTLSTPRQIQSSLTTPGRPQHHHLPEGDPDVLHSISRVVSPWHWQIRGPRTHKSNLEG